MKNTKVKQKNATRNQRNNVQTLDITKDITNSSKIATFKGLVIINKNKSKEVTMYTVPDTFNI